MIFLQFFNAFKFRRRCSNIRGNFGCAIAIVIISAVLKNYANWMALGEKIWLLSPWDLNK
jgi:hypothetical protein